MIEKEKICKNCAFQHNSTCYAKKQLKMIADTYTCEYFKYKETELNT